MSMIFCRHGETEYNLFDRFQGVSNSKLTERGKAQAARLGEFLKANYQVKAFYISPLERVRETCDIARNGIDAEVIVVPELRETCFGNWESRIRSEISPDILKEKELDRFNFVHPGEYQGQPGESYKMTLDRVEPLLQKLHEFHKTTRDLVIICHQGVMVGIHKYYLGLSNTEAGKLRSSNNHILIVNEENGVFTTEMRDLA